MSLNRENVVWEDSQSRWNIGFFDFHEGNINDPEYDEEWDVEYNNNFHYVSTGHRTKEEAMDAIPGPNPGSYNVFQYNGNEDSITEFDDSAGRLFEHIKNPKESKEHYEQWTQALGPEKHRNIESIAKEYYKLKKEAYYYKANGYLNPPDERIPNLEKRLNKFINEIDKNTNDKTLETINKSRESYAKNLQEIIDDHEKQNRYNFSGYRRNNSSNNDKELKEIKRVINETKPLTKYSKNNFQSSKNSNSDNSSIKILSDSSKNSIGTAGKYHINPKTGRPNKCTATKRGCPFGGSDSHYNDKESARQSYENKMKNQNFKSFKK